MTDYQSHNPNRPGKFQGEPAYVVMFYHDGLDGGADYTYQDQINGAEILVFDITDENAQEFPELAGHELCAIYEGEDGFVWHQLFEDQDDLEETYHNWLEM